VHEHVTYHSLHPMQCIYASISYLHVCDRSHGARMRGATGASTSRDRLTKSAHFIPIAMTYKVRQYVELYISHIVYYHSIPKSIIFHRGSIFIAHFWEQLHECLGTHLIRSSAYHLQTDGQTERVNQIIKDMLVLVF
jgi:hypothetical protein